jgi:anthranilate synthase component 1
MLTFDEFRKLAADYTLIPVARTISSDLLTPVAAFLKVAAKEKHSFLFESVHGGENVGRYTFIGVRPFLQLCAFEGTPTLVMGRGVKPRSLKGDLFAELKRIFSEHKVANIEGLPPFTCGAVGFFAYDLVRRLEPIPTRARNDLDVPDAYLMFFDRLLAFDHVRQQLHIIATANVTKESPQKAYKRALKDIAAIEKKLAGATPKLPKPKKEKITPKASVSHEKFLADVERAKEYIAAGDIFQLVLSQRLEFKTSLDPFAIYRALRQVNPSPYMYFLRGAGTVLGSSPEMLVKVNGDTVQYRPIAGTRPRGKSEADDARLEAELRADEKERAEHIMLVDLGRNDLGRISEIGSVKVKDLMFVERYSHVMHLVSALEGKLRKGLTAWDAFASCFPAGTLTGAPKVRAMQIIEELEPVRRGAYGGSVFYADFAGNLDSCIAIRTMLMQGPTRRQRAYVQAGAGIVADSVPESEYQECLNKAQALIRAVELASSQR